MRRRLSGPTHSLSPQRPPQGKPCRCLSRSTTGPKRSPACRYRARVRCSSRRSRRGWRPKLNRMSRALCRLRPRRRRTSQPQRRIRRSMHRKMLKRFIASHPPMSLRRRKLRRRRARARCNSPRSKPGWKPKPGWRLKRDHMSCAWCRFRPRRRRISQTRPQRRIQSSMRRKAVRRSIASHPPMWSRRRKLHRRRGACRAVRQSIVWHPPIRRLPLRPARSAPPPSRRQASRLSRPRSRQRRRWPTPIRTCRHATITRRSTTSSHTSFTCRTANGSRRIHRRPGRPR